MWCFTILTSECAWRQNGGHFFNISTSKGDRRLRCFGMLTSTCASRHNGVQFLILHLPRWLYGAPAALVTPLCDPPGPQNIGKTHRFATFIPFFFCAPSFSFFWPFLFSDLLAFSLLFPSLRFASLLFSPLTSLSGCSSVHIVGSLCACIVFWFILWNRFAYHLFAIHGCHDTELWLVRRSTCNSPTMPRVPTTDLSSQVWLWRWKPSVACWFFHGQGSRDILRK